MSLTLDDFDYHLPQELIAQQPLHERAGSRLLHLEGEHLHDCMFADLPTRLNTGDLLVFNDTRVIHARLFGHKQTGGQVEVLVERPVGEHEALAQIRASKSPRPGSILHLSEELEVTVQGRVGAFFHLRFPDSDNVVALLERHGRLPLPPYITRQAGTTDETRYQTVFARHPGSVAAPTAGLHFDERILERLRQGGVELAWLTLHVGAGTFQPVRTHKPEEHHMHTERYILPEETVEAIRRTRERGGRVIAVGTTSLRALEGTVQRHARLEPGAGETDIFILPGFEFRVVDALITNFHLPRSTLLMLVSALAGMEPVRRAYAHAVAQSYRFFSYGDAMLITPDNHAV